MIEIKTTGMCKDCPNQHFELTQTVFATFSNESSSLWDVSCVHQNACDRIVKLYGKGTEIEVDNDNNSTTSS